MKARQACSQCGGPFFQIYVLNGVEHELCLPCSIAISTEQRAILDQKMRISNQLLEEEAITIGLPERWLGARYQLPGQTHLQNINISESAAGVVNFGTINGSLHHIDASIQVLKADHSRKDLVSALTRLSREVVSVSGLEDEQRAEALELIRALAEAATASKARRNRPVQKSLLKSLSELLNPVAALATIWPWAKEIVQKAFE